MTAISADLSSSWLAEMYAEHLPEFIQAVKGLLAPFNRYLGVFMTIELEKISE